MKSSIVLIMLLLSGAFAKKCDCNDDKSQTKECQVTFYTDDPSENDGYTTTADGSELDASQNIIAVTHKMYRTLEHKKIRIDGEIYTVRDICSSCTDEHLHVDMLVSSKKEAFDRGVYFTECEIIDK
jgi:3D (Asp-Asp-Asp) domain-containing protein